MVHCNGLIGITILHQYSHLFHSLGGISLSPTFVVMFAMQHYQISWEDALHLVQNRRYCISPNGGFLTQLKVSLLAFFRSSIRLTFYRNTKQYIVPVLLWRRIQLQSAQIPDVRELTRMMKTKVIGMPPLDPPPIFAETVFSSEDRKRVLFDDGSSVPR